MPGTLLPEDERTIQSSVRGYELLASTAARIYTAQQNQWSYSGKVGALALCRNRGTFQLQLVEIPSGRIVWDQDVSSDVKYQKDKPFFHSFVGGGSLYGISFADEGEASDFYDAFQRKESQPAVAAAAPPALPPQPPIRTLPSTPAPPPPARPSDSYAPPPQPAAPVTSGIVPSPSTESIKRAESTRSSVFGGIGMGHLRSKSKKKGGDGKIDKSMISAPVENSFQHVTHVGYSAQTGFTAKNLPKEWKAIFEKAGITEEQLQDKDTMKFAIKFVKKQLAKPVEATAPLAVAAPPPPPAIPNSAGGRRAPPPPPPANRRGPPPPPPRGGAPAAAPPEPPMRTPKMATSAPPPAPPRAVPPPSFADVTPSSGGAPPPPPPPPAGGPPPPPPPRADNTGPPAPRAPIAPPAAGAPDRSNLLDSIRNFSGGLKTVQKDESGTPSEDVSNTRADDIAGQLILALAQRKQFVADSDTDEDEEEDDSDWN